MRNFSLTQNPLVRSLKEEDEKGDLKKHGIVFIIVFH